MWREWGRAEQEDDRLEYSKQSTKETPGRVSSQRFGKFHNDTAVSSYHMPKICHNMLDARGLKKNEAGPVPDGSPKPHRGERWSHEKFQCPLLTKPGGAGAQGKGQLACSML